jgi:NADH:ubiquinone oxidoreductase subunit 2 (subunit N)
LVIEPAYQRILLFAGPELLLTVAAIVVLFVDMGGMRSTGRPTRRMAAAAIVGMGCLAAFLWTVLSEAGGTLPGAILVVDPLTNLAKQILLVVTIDSVSCRLNRISPSTLGSISR